MCKGRRQEDYRGKRQEETQRVETGVDIGGLTQRKERGGDIGGRRRGRAETGGDIGGKRRRERRQE
jgi:hypothetical protein